MSKLKILIQFDTDVQPSVFDSVVAVDSGIDHLFRHGGVSADTVKSLAYGAMFTRGPDDLHQTAIFIGGSNVAAGEALLKAVQKAFFGPVRVSVMMDSNGANTTAAAAVLAAQKHVPLQGANALVLAATGAVGQRAVRLLAAAGAEVAVASRDLSRARQVCDDVRAAVPNAQLSPCATLHGADTEAAMDGAQILIAAGAPGVQLVDERQLERASALQVAIDLNAVPPLGVEAVQAQDKGALRGRIACYGALGVGGTKMKIHKAAIRRLFDSNDQVLDAQEIFRIGSELNL